MLIEVTNQTVAVLSEISEQNVALSLDDFGTGYSSLDHLKLFPINILKIDKGFVSALGEGGKSEKLFLAIIAFAKALSMQIVVEGVETREQAEFCKRHGCDLLQGYFYAKPLPAPEFEALFLRGHALTNTAPQAVLPRVRLDLAEGQKALKSAWGARGK